ncbi:MAG: hypothetical protein WCK63_19230, partial [Betaproteobacteria bacterium]
MHTLAALDAPSPSTTAIIIRALLQEEPLRRPAAQGRKSFPHSTGAKHAISSGTDGLQGISEFLVLTASVDCDPGGKRFCPESS